MDGSVILGFVFGIITTLIGIAAKYGLEYRLSRREFEHTVTANVAETLGNSLGQLRRSIERLEDRLESLSRDSGALEWLRPASEPKDDGYYLKSFAYRLFAFIAFGSIFRDRVDAMPRSTLEAQPELKQIYALLIVAEACLTNRLVVHSSVDGSTDSEATLLFTGTIDDIADLGSLIYSDHRETIPRDVVMDEYDKWQSTDQLTPSKVPLVSLRSWISAPWRYRDRRRAAVLARMECLRYVLAKIDIGLGREPYDRAAFEKRLADLESGYFNRMEIATTLPDKVDALISKKTREAH